MRLQFFSLHSIKFTNHKFTSTFEFLIHNEAKEERELEEKYSGNIISLYMTVSKIGVYGNAEQKSFMYSFRFHTSHGKSYGLPGVKDTIASR